MKQLLLAGLGGFIGAAVRFQIGGWISRLTPAWKFPAGTFLINVSGCLLMGLLAGLAEKHRILSPEARIFLMTGILGGFTTFSAFGMETVHLLRRGETGTAFFYVSASVLCGLPAVWLGLKLTSGSGESP